eukprot:1084449-Pyramimonas_sp.AAC.1
MSRARAQFLSFEASLARASRNKSQGSVEREPLSPSLEFHELAWIARRSRARAPFLGFEASLARAA